MQAFTDVDVSCVFCTPAADMGARRQTAKNTRRHTRKKEEKKRKLLSAPSGKAIVVFCTRVVRDGPFNAALFRVIRLCSGPLDTKHTRYRASAWGFFNDPQRERERKKE